jgi:hypothetical protein
MAVASIALIRCRRPISHDPGPFEKWRRDQLRLMRRLTRKPDADTGAQAAGMCGI